MSSNESHKDPRKVTLFALSITGLSDEDGAL